MSGLHEGRGVFVSGGTTRPAAARRMPGGGAIIDVDGGRLA